MKVLKQVTDSIDIISSAKIAEYTRKEEFTHGHEKYTSIC
jgi:hypothetical protein